MSRYATQLGASFYQTRLQGVLLRLRHLRRAAPSRGLKIVVTNSDGDILFEVDDVSDATKESRIRERAKEIWEREGRPEGRDQEHWDKAAEELKAELGD